MKAKKYVLLLVLLILNSCIVKSLHPFYTKKSIVSDTYLLGKWKDNKGNVWKVTSFSKEIVSGKSLDSLSKEDLKLYYKYLYSYKIERTTKEGKTYFLAMPFKVNNQVFLDFTPLEFDENRIEGLLRRHLISVHSLVKYDVETLQKISFRWLDESKIKELFESNSIKIKHEKIGMFNDIYLLTAKSEELEKFIKKYMASSDKEKWKTSTKYTLTKINEKS